MSRGLSFFPGKKLPFFLSFFFRLSRSIAQLLFCAFLFSLSEEKNERMWDVCDFFFLLFFSSFFFVRKKELKNYRLKKFLPSSFFFLRQRLLSLFGDFCVQFQVFLFSLLFSCIHKISLPKITKKPLVTLVSNSISYLCR